MTDLPDADTPKRFSDLGDLRRAIDRDPPTDAGVLRIMAALLRQCEGQLREARERADFLEAATEWASQGWSGILKKAFEIKKERDELRAENERLHRIVARLTDRLGELHDAGMDASGEAVDWRARAIEHEREAARLREQRNEALEDNLRLLGELGRARNGAQEMLEEAQLAAAERDDLQAQLDAGLADCLEMHAEFVKVERERDEMRNERNRYRARLYDAREAMNELIEILGEQT